jgi:alanine-synthesizing transaminase
MQFSDLTAQFPGDTNRLYRRLGELKRQFEILDLVQANPSDIGVAFPKDSFNSLLQEASEQARVYRPDPMGQPAARDAIAAHYAHPKILPEHILLTPGSSIAYWYAFKLLCNAGDNVLCPVPSYPLFDYIARLAGVEISSYRLVEPANWEIDLDHLEAQVNKQTRAIALISPHNPTGMVAGPDQIDGVVQIASRHRLPILADEVFWSFVFDGTRTARPLETEAPLVFTLNGFSKMYALPGLKLGWMTVSGEEPLVRQAVKTLELISDTFLPVNEIIQFAVPAVFERGVGFIKEYQRQVLACRNTALEALSPVLGAPPAGGFYLVVRCLNDEEELAIQLLEEDRVLVHPGYFYDIEGSHLVFSFLKPRHTLAEVLPRIRKRIQAFE